MGEELVIDAEGMHYTPLNKMIRGAAASGVKKVILKNVCGQRFIANGLKCDGIEIEIQGVPGGDLSMFMNGPEVTVYGNADHAPGNTMDGGRLIIHGSTGDAVAHSMRGGEVYVRDDVGYRAGIHMKAYMEKKPVLVVGGQSRSFLGEYMAGGILVVLGIGKDCPVEGRGVGSGIHGGSIFLRNVTPDEVDAGIGAKVVSADEEDMEVIKPYILNFCRYFDNDPEELMKSPFVKITPASARPFANKYCWE